MFCGHHDLLPKVILHAIALGIHRNS